MENHLSLNPIDTLKILTGQSKPRKPTNEEHWRARLANQGQLRTPKPALGQKIENKIADALQGAGVSPRYANHLARRSMDAFNDLTPVGNATGADVGARQFRRGVTQGDLKTALLGALVFGASAAPIPSGAKRAVGPVKQQFKNMLNDTSGAIRAWHGSTEPFQNWFGDSKVVDAEGRPLVVYHGTTGDFDAFDNKKTGSNDGGLWGRGHYFSASPEGPNSYALRQGDGARVIPAYVSMQNPLVLKTGSDLVTRLPDGANSRDLIGNNLDGAKIKELALAGGNDGVIQIRPDGSIGDLVAYEPTQIKSATGNRGTYDPRDPRFTR